MNSCLCGLFACVITVIGFPAGTVVKAADVTAPRTNKDPGVIDNTILIFPASVA